MVILNNGNTLRCLCRFEHIGAAYVGAKLYAAIGKKGITFDEISGMNGTTIITNIQNDSDWQPYQVTVDIPIDNIGGVFGAKPGSDYEVMVKLMSIPGSDIYWYGPLNDITLEGEAAEAEFKDLTVSYAKA